MKSWTQTDKYAKISTTAAAVVDISFLKGRLLMIYAIIAVVLILLDQLTKYIVRANIPLGGSVDFIPGFLDFTYVKNTGAAFSILREHTWLLTLISAIIILVVAWLVVKGFFRGWFGLTTATLILAGGVGNLIDRVCLGYVTDMIRTLFMDFPVFNLADCCITVGVVMLFIYVLFFCKDEKKEETHGTDLPADGQ